MLLSDDALFTDSRLLSAIHLLPETSVLYGLCGLGLFGLGLYGALLPRSLFARILAINISSAGVFLVLVALAYGGPQTLPDPLPHALVLTGLVVAVSATALALVLDRRLHNRQMAAPDACSVTSQEHGHD